MKIVPMSVEYVDHMGSDLSVVNAARVSFDKESSWEAVVTAPPSNGKRLRSGDVGLINYLAKHNHWTPFGHTSVSVRIKAPIFVARQLVKHQVGLVWNEVSRRYVDSEPEFFVPDEWRGRAENVKQGSSSEVVLTRSVVGLEGYIEQSVAFYQDLLDSGVCPEQARMVLPLNTMTEWIWTGNLASFSRVCNLRLDPHTQLETQEPAQMISSIIQPLFPVSWAALIKD